MYEGVVIGALLQQRLGEDASRPALSDGVHTWSRAELDAAARAWAERFAGHRRVGLLADNGLELAAAFIGALYAGAAVVPFHAQTPPAEVHARRARFAVDVLVTEETLATQRVPRGVGHAPHELALLLGTSGTTGEPRAVAIEAGGLAAHALALVEATGLSADDRVLAALPLAHSYGCRMALIVPLLAGAEVLLLPRFSARGVAAMLDRVTWMPVVPTMLSALVATSGPTEGSPSGLRGPSSLKWVLSAGAPLPEALRVAAEARLGCTVREGYGLTEASFSTIDGPRDAASPGTVGRPVGGVEVRIVAGEVQLRGPNVMQGYLDDVAATEAAFTADGWLRTGDVGELVGGRLRIVDRIKDIILRGGQTIYPGEVEAALAAHPAVVAVAVVGRAHAHLGEEVVAHVVLRAPIDLAPWARERLSAYKVPAAFVVHEALPLGPSGKVLKRALRMAVAPERLA